MLPDVLNIITSDENQLIINLVRLVAVGSSRSFFFRAYRVVPFSLSLKYVLFKWLGQSYSDRDSTHYGYRLVICFV